jgi:DNA-binding CsgD family transcriptional regulator
MDRPIRPLNANFLLIPATSMLVNNTEIAQALYLSEGTVKNHVTQILSKLEMRDRVAAALWAQQNLL